MSATSSRLQVILTDAPSMSVSVDNDSEFTVYLRSFSEGTGGFELMYASEEEALAGVEDSKPIAPYVFLPAVIALIEEHAPEPDPRYTAEVVTSPTSGNLVLKNATITTLNGALTSANDFRIQLPTPIPGKANESIVYFEAGATLPVIQHPENVIWFGKELTVAINKKNVFVYWQVETATGWVIQLRGDANV